MTIHDLLRMIYFLYTLFFVSCVVLVISVLLQPGKTDAGALFTSNVSSNAFGPRGTATVLSKLTIGAAVVFMLSALLISMPAITGDISVLSTTSGTTETNQPANTNANADANAANANVAVDANTAVNSNSNAAETNANTANNTNSNAAVNTNINKNSATANTNKPAENK